MGGGCFLQFKTKAKTVVSKPNQKVGKRATKPKPAGFRENNLLIKTKNLIIFFPFDSKARKKDSLELTAKPPDVCKSSQKAICTVRKFN